MPKVNYNGENGTFSITHIKKDDLKELVDVLEGNVISDSLRIFQKDIEDDLDIMNINSKEEELPF